VCGYDGVFPCSLPIRRLIARCCRATLIPLSDFLGPLLTEADAKACRFFSKQISASGDQNLQLIDFDSGILNHLAELDHI